MGGGKVVHAYAPTSGGGMYKAPLAHINACMCGRSARSLKEHHQVARAQLLSWHRLPPSLQPSDRSW